MLLPARILTAICLTDKREPHQMPFRSSLPRKSEKMFYLLCLPEMKGRQHKLPLRSSLPRKSEKMFRLLCLSEIKRKEHQIHFLSPLSRKSEKIFLMCALQANIFNATVHFAKRIKTNGHTYTKQIRAGLPNTKKSYAINLAPF